MTFHRRSLRMWAVLVALMIAVPCLLGQGCPSLPFAPSLGSGSGVVVLSPTLDQNVAAGANVTIVYDANVSAGTTIQAFYDRNGTYGDGDEVVFATNLASGSSRFVQLSTAGISAGELYVGIQAVGAFGVTNSYAPATLTIGSSAASVTVTSPSEDMNTGPGTQVPVQFVVSEGVSNFTYTVFYDRDGSFNGDEITIQSGSGSGSTQIDVTWNTTGLAIGSYRVGVTLNSSSTGSSTAYADGAVNLVSGAFIQMLAPLAGSIIPAGVLVEIEFSALDPQTPDATVRLFYDYDGKYNTGDEVTIANVAATSGSTLWDTTVVTEASYYIGATLLSTSPAITSFTDGPVTISGIGSGSGSGGGTGPGGGDQSLADQLNFLMTAPAVDVTVFEGQLVPARWTTSTEAGEATMTLFYEPDFNNDGEPDGDDTRIVFSPEGVDSTAYFWDWNTGGAIGTYFVGGTLSLIDGGEATEYAEGLVTIRPHRMWVGHFGSQFDEDGNEIAQKGAVQGAVLKGHNFGDNAGSQMMMTTDYDGDGINEIVVAAQFGKPFFFASEGRGAGEAYMIYGSQGRMLGDYELNETGHDGLPGVLLTGIIPNPNPPTSIEGLAGNSIPYDPELNQAEPYASEGLRTMMMIPDQDGDELPELVFGFPFCNSYSLRYQYGFNDTLYGSEGRLENNGHFLRGGMVTVSSHNALLTNRNAVSRHLDRVIQLQRVGQVFEELYLDPHPAEVNGLIRYRGQRDVCGDAQYPEFETVTWPCEEGFWQNTTGTYMDPPRLADPFYASGLRLDFCYMPVSTAQIDPVPLIDERTGAEVGGFYTGDPGDGNICGNPIWPTASVAWVMNSGFYTVNTGEGDERVNSCGTAVISPPLEPYGCRILGQTTSQFPTASEPETYANRFGSAMSISGDFMLIGAPNRTVERSDVATMPELRRDRCGQVYMYGMNRRAGNSDFPYSVPDVASAADLPAPHNHIIEDLGYWHCGFGGGASGRPNAFDHELVTPFHIVGAAPGDRVGTSVAGLGDINGDGVTDFALGGEGTNDGRGSIYVIYRRQPEVEGDYLLERLQIETDDLNRLNGLMISGRPQEDLGAAIAGGADYNGDGKDDLIVGSPNAGAGGKFHSGEVFILFGGKNLLSPAAGSTIPELRDAGDGMVLAGENAGDEVGTTVADAGDINGDGINDILIAAPNASPYFDSTGDGIRDKIGLDLNGDRLQDDLNGDGTADDMTGAGLLYIVLGGEHLSGTIGLEQIGTANLPGFVLIGRKGGDHMGGGLVQNGLLSRGISGAGDFDGDGRDDIMISSVLADPDGKTNAGEVYLMYGFTPPTIQPR